MNQAHESFLYNGILPRVQRPSRYIDGELNRSSTGYGEGLFNVLLVFPDAYEIGMSHQGIQLLYRRLSGMEGVGVEFAFAPWPDAEELMRSSGETIRSWQTGTPAHAFDLIGFSLTYELHYTNVLMILDLAGLDLSAAGRADGDPVVVAGGPCCSNPLPFINAVDAVFLGDAEESLPEAVYCLQRARASGATRTRLREALAGISGVYVDGITSAAEHRTYRLRTGDLFGFPVVPSAGIVHDRLAVEIMRGCTRGCRYCHAGFFYRPCRERDVSEIVDAVCAGLDATGWETVSLLSLSTSDYSGLDELLQRLAPELERRQVSLALPSLRPETITPAIIDAASRVRRSGFTIAPEAGTERLRRVINREMSDEEILAGCRRILEGGCQNLKLYFMIGLPTETEDDLLGIARLVGSILDLPRTGRRFSLGVSVSPFVPKPHTPFQWERQCSLDEIGERERVLSRYIRSRRVQLSLRDPQTSVLEGILSRGDRRLWDVLVTAYHSGCRFDGWRDQLRFDLWLAALQAHGLGLVELTAAVPVESPLPWSAFSTRVKHAYLVRERERALSGEVTPDCRTGRCSGCGACGEDNAMARTNATERTNATARMNATVKTNATVRTGDAVRTGGGPVERVRPIHPAGFQGHPQQAYRYRCIFEKTGRERFLSHREVIALLQRALRRSGLPVHYTEGFHPHPRLSFGPSLPVGTEGIREFFDVELVMPAAVAPGLFDSLLPAGIRVRECTGPFSRSEGRLSRQAIFVYEVDVRHLEYLYRLSRTPHKSFEGQERMWYLLCRSLRGTGEPAEEFDAVCSRPALTLLERWTVLFRRGAAVTGARMKERDCTGCSVELTDGGALKLSIPATERGIVTPQDLLEAVIPVGLATLARIKRLEILFKKRDNYLDPIALVKGL